MQLQLRRELWNIIEQSRQNKSKGVAIACTKFIENNLSAINKKAANIKEQIQQIHKI